MFEDSKMLSVDMTCNEIKREVKTKYQLKEDIIYSYQQKEQPNIQITK